MQNIPTSNFFVLTQPLLNGLEIRIYGIEYKKFDAEPFLWNCASEFFINADKIESRIISTNLFTQKTLHHFIGRSIEEVDKANIVKVEETRQMWL